MVLFSTDEISANERDWLVYIVQTLTCSPASFLYTHLGCTASETSTSLLDSPRSSKELFINSDTSKLHNNRKKLEGEVVREGQSAMHQRSLSANSETSKLNVSSNNKLPSTSSLVKLDVPKEGSKLQARTPNTPPTARPLTSAQRSLKGSRSPSRTSPKVAKTNRRARERVLCMAISIWLYHGQSCPRMHRMHQISRT